MIADLYERYVNLIGTEINEEGDTMTDGYVESLSHHHDSLDSGTDTELATGMPWTSSDSTDTAADA